MFSCLQSGISIGIPIGVFQARGSVLQIVNLAIVSCCSYNMSMLRFALLRLALLLFESFGWSDLVKIVVIGSDPSVQSQSYLWTSLSEARYREFLSFDGALKPCSRNPS